MRNEEGFTLIELLVVILIIGIMAAIVLPTFLGKTDPKGPTKTHHVATPGTSKTGGMLAP